jgi:hypothetical protein
MKTQRQIFAVQKANEQKILKVCPEINKNSGIYIFTRVDENGIKYAYIGQAVNMLRRAAQHLEGYQHIDLSIKKHGLFELDKNKFGWKLWFFPTPESELDAAEQEQIKIFADEGYQLRNQTLGGQKDKKGMEGNKRKGYLQGKHDGYEKAQKEFAELLRAADGNGLKSRNAKIKLEELKK